MTRLSLSARSSIAGLLLIPVGAIRRYGKALFREQLRLVSGKHSHVLIVDELPHEVGVDPFALLIDRVTADNLKKL